jgi:hypothetical protein
MKMDNFEKLQQLQNIRRRKKAGWILLSYGMITFIPAVLAIVFLILMISWASGDLNSNDVFVAVMASWVIYIAMAGILILLIIAIFSILKFITGVMVHKGKNIIFVVTVMIVSMVFSFGLIFLSLSFMLVTMSIALSSLIFILASVIDITIWAYLIRVLKASRKSFGIKDLQPNSIQATGS